MCGGRRESPTEGASKDRCRQRCRSDNDKINPFPSQVNRASCKVGRIVWLHRMRTQKTEKCFTRKLCVEREKDRPREGFGETHEAELVK